MDPFSIIAGGVGIAVPALQGVQMLISTVRNIKEAPLVIQALETNLVNVQRTLTSLQAIDKSQWDMLNHDIIGQSHDTMMLCKTSCEHFKAELDRWTRHSDGALSWQDRIRLSVLKQDQIKSVSKQLQNCHITLSSVFTTATFQSSLQQMHEARETTALIETNDAQFKRAIEQVYQRVAQVDTQLSKLCLVGLGQYDTIEDRNGAVRQIEAEHAALTGSQELLRSLAAEVKNLAQRKQEAQSQVVNNFGNMSGGGIMVATNCGSIVWGAK